MQKVVMLIPVLIGVPFLCELSQGGEPTEHEKLVRRQLDAQGWIKQYDRGEEIRKELSSLDPDARKKVSPKAFRGEKVSFAGSVAPPGSTNDLITADGFYLRVITKNGTDLRPQATAWAVVVYGTIQQVLPANKLIVIEVEEKDWVVYMSS